MPRIRAERLAFGHTDAVAILAAASFTLEPGWTGLVGENGAGKTTLLRLLAGELSPTGGDLRIDPAGARVVLCRQEIEKAGADVHGFALAGDRGARRLHGILALEAGELERWPTLSPGERKRWQLGAALWAEPEVLLLDEPTNHLDATGRARLLEALRRHRGVGVLVSHDRALLDELTGSTLRLHRGDARLWTGGYSAARDGWEAERHGQLAARDAARESVRKAARQLDRARRDLAGAERTRSAARRMRGPRDSDARSIVAQGRADAGAAAHARRAAVLRDRLARRAEAVPEAPIEAELGGSVFARWQPSPGRLLAARPAGPLVAGDRVLVDAPALEWRRDDRIWVAGDNGTGKSTLVAALLAGARVPIDRLLVLPQELTESEAAASLAAVRRLPADERGRVLSVVAALGVDPDRLLASRRPSPGEARKLTIATGLGRHAWGLVLDEPTNHLDLPSIERLQAALAAYPGALLLVSHDPALAAACTRTRWRLGSGTIEVQ